MCRGEYHVTHKFKGSCTCGEVSFSLSLSQSLDAYSPRACDCDFCAAREIVYLSDPKGALELHSKLPLKTLVQGSEQAQFLLCASCNSVVAVVHSFQSGLKGAVNASLIKNGKQLQEVEIVSPKLLSPTEKIERWNRVWLQVIVNDQKII